MRCLVVARILAFLAIEAAAQHQTYTVLALPAGKPISPISPIPPSSTIFSIATITTAPTPYFPATRGNLTTGTLPSNTTSCDRTLCIDYINTCSIMYGGCFPHCSGMTTPSFSNPGCPSNRYFPGKTPDASMTTATCGYKCDNYVDACGQTYGPGCYTSCEGMPTPGWSTPSCDGSATMTGSGQAVVVTEAVLSASSMMGTATAGGLV